MWPACGELCWFPNVDRFGVPQALEEDSCIWGSDRKQSKHLARADVGGCCRSVLHEDARDSAVVVKLMDSLLPGVHNTCFGI